MYRFDSSVLSLASLAGLPAGVLAYADYLVIDLDNVADLGAVYSDALAVAKSLDAIKTAYQVWFSGGKGFHIYIPTSQFGFEPTADEGVLKRMAEAICQGVKSFDPSVYNKTRIFRYPGTFNQKGGLYKVEIAGSHTWGNVWPSLEQIVEDAKQKPEGGQLLSATDFPLNEALVQLYEACKVRVNRPVQENIKEGNGTLFVKVEEGGRNEAAYSLTRKLARRGIFEKDAEFIVQAWNNKYLPKPLPQTEITKVVQSAYTKGMNEHVDEGTYAKHLYSIDRALSHTNETFSGFGKGAFKTGYEFLDNYTMGFQPQELIFWLARPGNFKTAVLSNILQRGSQLSNKPALFFSMEMGVHALTVRHVQQAEGVSKKESLQLIKERKDLEKTREAFRNVHVVGLSRLNTDRLLGLIDFYLETFGELSAVGIDYLGLFDGCANNTERTARQATELKTVIAKAANCPVFCLVQAKREYEGREGDIELDRTAGKDSSSIEDSADYLIGSWGKWHNFEHGEEKVLYGRFLKSRGFDSDEYKPNPYFGLNLDKRTMNLKDVVYIPNPPKFNQLKGEKE